MEKELRRCAGCRQIRPKSDFWRIVRLYPSGAVQLDTGQGRSAYLCPQASCLKAARHKNRLGRALKATIPDGLYDQLDERLTGLGKSLSELGDDFS
jgi:predicted RNA-binding protein YlxR (DUF448 family)